jgi:ABC-2 type transport system ATP-binding protein
MIELKNLQKVIGGHTVLEIDALTVRAGERVAVGGPADSGTAELLDLLTGRSRPTDGTVRIAGLDPARDRERLSRQIGVLSVENGLYGHRTARANLAFHGRMRGLPRTRADEVLSQVGLGDHAHVHVDRLPMGMARRLAFGRAMLHQPVILLLAEPFAGCDPHSITLLSGLIRQSACEGSAVLILASEATSLAHLCRSLYRLEHGRLAPIQEPEEARRAELPFKIPARLEDRVALINPADVLYVSADEGHACLHTSEGRVPTQFTLAELEARLARSGFFRAHRSYLVNLQRVKAVIPYTRDSFDLVLDDPTGTQIPLSKSAARDLRDLLGY